MDIKTFDLLSSTDSQLIKISRDYVLSLSLVEMQAVRGYFKKLKRNPTDIEMETIAQTWSEHCKHKTLAGTVEYSEYEGRKLKKSKTYKNLLKETVFRATKELNKPWCVSVFQDNAGVIEFNRDQGIAFKVETHNHPSALEPYGGSATGIGGVIRDILGVGLGAKPLANTDVFCFGEPELPWKQLPKGVLHPKRIAKGVVSGVRDYGNRMGIPTVNGAVYFDQGYISNPLVFCGTMGIIPKSKCFKKVLPGDLILVVGGKTGRDGIHGATFSSIELDQASDVSAVQIGNPIVEKKVLDTVLAARDKNLYRAITDCGAGGLSSAVGELGSECGARVLIEKILLKYKNLRPWEIWLSEAQERMVLAVPPENKEKLLEIFRAEDVDATYIGEFTRDKKLTILNNNHVICQLDMLFLHEGVPGQRRKAVWHPMEEVPGRVPDRKKVKYLGQDLKKLLASLNICSKEWIIRQYDHEVQGQTVVKPIHGASNVLTGPGDAAVIWPYAHVKNSFRGIVLSNGMNPEYGKIDPYWMAASAIDEALRNAVSVGADPDRIAILDNFCWGNTDDPKQLGGLVRAAEACFDMAKAFETPFISGKDSLHNEYRVKQKSYSIPGSLLISAVGLVNDIRKTVTMELKEAGNLIYVLGVTKNEMGGSHYNKINGFNAGSVPKVDPIDSRKLMSLLNKAIEKGLVSSCHDCSEGGIGVALAEMVFAGDKGAELDLSLVPIDAKLEGTEILFSESNSRFLVEVSSENKVEFEKVMKGSPASLAGVVTVGKRMLVKDGNDRYLIDEKIGPLRQAWKSGLDW
jgi:phosphoribosylformylglycinamidine synthase II